MSSGGRSFHKKDWLTLGAGAALAATGLGAAGIGPMAGLLGGATGAAGVGASGAAAAGGAAAGAAGTAGGTAGMFGAAPGLAGSLLAPSATPMLTGFGGGAALADMGAGTAGLFGAGATNTGTLANLGNTFSANAMPNITFEKGLKALQNAQKFQKMAQGPESPAPMPAPMPQRGGGGSGGELAQLSQLFSNPVGQAKLAAFLRQRGIG